MSNIIFNQSIFKQFFSASDPDAQAWSDNVLNKVLQSGILPKYVKQNDDSGNPTEVEALYESITLFFAYFVRFAREFRDFKDNDWLVDKYLNHTGQFTCSEETLAQLQYLVSNLLRIRAQRGGIGMLSISTDSDIPHGELRRLVCWDTDIYFKFGLGRPQFNSWNLNNSCPIGGENTGRYDLNSSWENTEIIEDLSLYPLIASENISIDEYEDRQCMFIEDVPNGTISGIGANEASKRIQISTDLNFEITFDVAQSHLRENLTFGCLAYDVDGNSVSLKSAVTGLDDSIFFTRISLNKIRKFYRVRGIIYNKYFDNISAADALLNIGYGNQLRFNNGIRSIIPYIVVDNANNNINSGAYIYNVKVTPCSFNCKRNFLNNKNFIDVIFYNGNGKYSISEINSIFRDRFIPYNTPFKGVSINLELDDPEEDIPPYVPPNLPDYLVYEDGGLILYEGDSDDMDSDSSDDNDAVLLENQV